MKRYLKKLFTSVLLGCISLAAVTFIGFNTERIQPVTQMQSLLPRQELAQLEKQKQPSSSTKFKSTPWLHVDGIDIKDPRGNKVVLRGISLPDLAINDYRKGADKSPVQLINMLTDKANNWYTTVVRLPVYPTGTLSYNANPKKYYNNYIKPAVNACVQKGIYCIIDWHYIDNPASFDSETRAFWTDIAPKFKNYPNIIFEVFNENSTRMPWAEWKNIVQPWVDIIRSYAPNNLILVGAPQYAQHLYDAPNNPIEGRNIVYVAHIYPGLDQSKWDSWIFNVANRIPIFVTEWGFRKGAEYPTNGTITSFAIPLKQKIEQYHLSWTCWVADHSWYPQMFDKKWNLLIGENYMGGFVKNYLYEKRTQLKVTN